MLELVLQEKSTKQMARTKIFGGLLDLTVLVLLNQKKEQFLFWLSNKSPECKKIHKNSSVPSRKGSEKKYARMALLWKSTFSL